MRCELLLWYVWILCERCWSDDVKTLCNVVLGGGLAIQTTHKFLLRQTLLFLDDEVIICTLSFWKLTLISVVN